MDTTSMTETVQLTFPPTDFCVSQSQQQAQGLTFVLQVAGGVQFQDQMPREQGVTSNGGHGVHNGEITSAATLHGGHHHYTNHGHPGGNKNNNSHHLHPYNNNNNNNQQQHFSNNDANCHGNHHNGNNNNNGSNRGPVWGYRSRGPNRFRCENIASTLNIYQNLHCVARFGGLPWKKPERQYKPGQEGLTEEIQDFYKYITPTAEEHAARDSIVSQLKELITAEWPHAELHVFGSFRTNLYLPTGDIDLVIQGNWGHIPPLFDLERFLVEKGFCERSTLRVLDKATVPLIKFRDRKTDIAVDISLNQVNCTKAADFVLNCTKRFPCLSPLTMVLKQFLSERNLNEVFFGGLSSYSLVLMILTFLQLHQNEEMVSSQRPELGTLLLEFLEFFGEKFDYENYGLRIKQGGHLVKKEDLRREMVCALAGAINPAQAGNPSPQCVLTIEDPVTPGNDVARASYSVGTVKEEFKLAHQYLRMGLTEERDPTHSILGRIIRVTDQVVYQRLRIRHFQRNPELRTPAATTTTNSSLNQEETKGDPHHPSSPFTYDHHSAITITNANATYSSRKNNIGGNHKSGGNNNKSNGVHNGCSPGRKSGGGSNKRRNTNDLARETTVSNDDVAAGGDSLSTVVSPSGNNNRRPSTSTGGVKDATPVASRHNRQNTKEQNNHPTENIVGDRGQGQVSMTPPIEPRGDHAAVEANSALDTEECPKTVSTASAPSSGNETGKIADTASNDNRVCCVNERTSEENPSHAVTNSNSSSSKRNAETSLPPNQNIVESAISSSRANGSIVDGSRYNPVSGNNGKDANSEAFSNGNSVPNCKAPAGKSEDSCHELSGSAVSSSSNNHHPDVGNAGPAGDTRDFGQRSEIANLKKQEHISAKNSSEREAFDRIILGDLA